MFAIAIAVVLGAVFYGLNNTSINQAGTAPPAQTAQTQPANPAAPPGMRDVTPRDTASRARPRAPRPPRPAPPPDKPLAPRWTFRPIRPPHKQVTADDHSETAQRARIARCVFLAVI